MIIKNFHWFWKHWLEIDTGLEPIFNWSDLQHIQWENFNQEDIEYIN